MWAGGDHFGPWGAMGMTTAYATAGLLCPDSLPNEPNFAHASQLHHTLADAAEAIVAGWDGSQLYPTSLLAKDSTSGEALVVWRTHYNHGNRTATFLYNNHTTPNHTVATLEVEGIQLTIPAGSITVLVDGKPRANTATLLVKQLPARRTYRTLATVLNWSTWREPPVATTGGIRDAIAAEQPVQQLNLTHGHSEFAIFTTRVDRRQLQNSRQLTWVGSCGMAYVIFINGDKVGEQVNMGGTGGCGVHCTDPLHPTGGCGHSAQSSNQIVLRLNRTAITSDHYHYDTGMKEDTSTLTILAESLGLPTNIPSFGCRRGLLNATLDGDSILTGWNSSAGLMGEALRVYSRAGRDTVAWTPLIPWAQGKRGPALSWYSTTFDTPDDIGANASGLFLNATGGLQRGQVYLNGEQLGRVWTMTRNDGSGPTQGLYSLPTSLLQPNGALLNILTLVDVTGAHDLASVHLVQSIREPQMLTWPPDKPSAAMGQLADCTLKTDDDPYFV